MNNPQDYTGKAYDDFWADRAHEYSQMAAACRAEKDYGNARIWEQLCREALDTAQSAS